MPKSTALARTLPLALALSACAVDMGSLDPDTGFLPESQDAEQVIIGSINWVEVTDLAEDSAERMNSHAVAYLSIPAKGTRCTGFLISDDVVMTNEHCIGSASDAAGVVAYFRREAGVPWNQWAQFTCDEFIGNSASLDYALLRCQGSPGQTHGVVTLAQGNPSSSASIYVIHQNCDYYEVPGCAPTKKYSPGQLTGTSGSDFRHNADTLGGSSGSPVFSSSSHEVVALHHVGVGNDGNGRGSYNSAVKITLVKNDITSRFPAVSFGAGTASPPPPPPAGDAFEPNNTTAAATALGLPAFASDLTIGTSDVDVFRFDVTEAGTLRVDLDFAHASGDLDVTLHSGSTQNPAVAQAVSGTDDETLSLAVTPGSWYVVVFGYNGAQNGYALAASFTPDVPASPSPAEQPSSPPASADDNTLQTAQLIALPFAADDAIDAAGDEDFFRFDTSGGATRVDLTFSHAAGDLDLYLYDAAGQQVGSSTSVTNDEAIHATLAAGTYYVRVIGYSGASNSYHLGVD